MIFILLFFSLSANNDKKWSGIARLMNAFNNANSGFNSRSINPLSIKQLYYKVVEGDTLSAIADKYHTSVSILMNLNAIISPDQIFIGMIIKIPKDSAADDTVSEVTANQLSTFGWKNTSLSSVSEINYIISFYSINTKKRICHFLAQCAFQSSFGHNLVETETEAESYGDFDDVLGNIQPGDGYKFRGAGYLPIVGRKAYESFAMQTKDISVLLYGADYVSENYPWTAAGSFWMQHGLNEAADVAETVIDVTEKIRSDEEVWKTIQSYYESALALFE